MTKSILALGLPAGFQNAIFAIANLFIQAGVNSFDSLMVKGNCCRRQCRRHDLRLPWPRSTWPAPAS